MIQEKGVGSCVTPCKTVTLDEVGFDSREIIDGLDGRSFRRVMEPEASWKGLKR